MSSAEGQLSRKLSIALLKKSFSSLSLSNLNFTNKLDSPRFVSTSSSSPTKSNDTATSHKPLNITSCHDYPGQLGESVHNSRFKLVRKLGKGNYSTVWLAKDINQADYVALKILTNRATRCHAMRMTDEVSILKTISTSDPSHPGFSHTITLSDHFSLQSIHGEHLGLAFKDVLGQSICDLRRRSPMHTLSLEVVRRVLKQVLLALEYIHNYCKIVHTDLKPDSILICFNDPKYVISHLPEDSLSKSSRCKLSRDRQEAPINPIPTPSDMLDDHSVNVKLIDFGHAQRVDEHLTDQIQAPSLRAPEVILGYSWDSGVDIWSLGCIAFELLTGQWLFQPKASRVQGWTEEDQHLQRMVEYTGEVFPENMLKDSSRGTQYFDETGRFRRIRSLHPVPLEKALWHYKSIPDSEIPGAARFMRRCLALDPRERATAEDLLSDTWVRGCI